MYCDLTDLKNALPEVSLIQLTDDSDAGVVDTDKTDSAMTDAAELIDGYLRGRYTLPLDPTPNIVQRLSVDISIYYLYQRRLDLEMPESLENRYKTGIKLLERIMRGEVTFAQSGDDDATPEQIRVNKIASDRLFTMENMDF